MSRTARIFTILCLVFVMAGCADDPYSRKRIQRRHTLYNDTVRGLNRREARSPENLNNTIRDIERKARRDEQRFNDRAARIGDYIW